MRTYAKYIIPDMFVMLQHEFNIKENESLDHSVATIAPKGNDYSHATSL